MSVLSCSAWPSLRRILKWPAITCGERDGAPWWALACRPCNTGPASHLVVGGPVDAPGLLTSDDLHRANQKVNVRLRIERVEGAMVSTCMQGSSSACNQRTFGSSESVHRSASSNQHQ